MKKTAAFTIMLILGALNSSIGQAAAVTESSLLRACSGKARQPFIAFNHYCYGVRRIYEAGKLYDNPQKRKVVLKNALDDFRYVFSHVPMNEKNRKHAPVIAITSIQKGRALVMLGRLDEAIDAYNYAIQLDPLQPKAYAGLSDVYKRRGMKDLALGVIEDGLKRLPKSKMLIRRKNRLQKQ